MSEPLNVFCGAVHAKPSRERCRAHDITVDEADATSSESFAARYALCEAPSAAATRRWIEGALLLFIQEFPSMRLRNSAPEAVTFLSRHWLPIAMYSEISSSSS